ncbi:hypothetical protein ABT174_23440 [Streptomyces sparsogenes]|uniref:hypothetical protein n=1 Tax=Streptomyces sparsogenes TaxID=67365 RepID=UPI00332DA57B
MPAASGSATSTCRSASGSRSRLAATISGLTRQVLRLGAAPFLGQPDVAQLGQQPRHLL